MNITRPSRGFWIAFVAVALIASLPYGIAEASWLALGALVVVGAFMAFSAKDQRRPGSVLSTRTARLWVLFVGIATLVAVTTLVLSGQVAQALLLGGIVCVAMALWLILGRRRNPTSE